MSDWKPGTRVGQLVLVELLGAGGMGEVYLAEHLELGRRYAVKALSPQADPELVERFRREGEAQAAVDDHPNVVRVHQAGQVGGRMYLVMDCMPGGDLGDRLREGPLPLDEGVWLVSQLAAGLSHVHAKGILHRDLKPDNVLFDEHGTPKLCDFGLARLDHDIALTASGVIMGTPGFMAPEQANGETVDERTDVYGLGAIFYAVLTGRPPFVGGTAISLMSKVLMSDPDPPSTHVPDLPATVDRVCLVFAQTKKGVFELDPSALDREPRVLFDEIEGEDEYRVMAMNPSGELMLLTRQTPSLWQKGRLKNSTSPAGVLQIWATPDPEPE